MIAYINVFTPCVGYSHHVVDLGFTILPKYKLKKVLADTMDKWFVECKNVYLRTYGNPRNQNSFIVHISFN